MKHQFSSLRAPIIALTVVWSLLSGGCAGLPKAPKYPNYGPYKTRENVIREAEMMSDRLQRHIEAWFDGRASAEIPDEFLPPGRKPWFTKFKLIRADETANVKQWTIRDEIERIDWNRVPGYFGDPHVTYMVHPFFLPTGAKIIVEGEFPHSRYFSLQVTPPFEPRNYRYDSIGGVPEVPLFDVDIRPNEEHTNPFVVGANRRAARRSYRAEFEVAVGDPVALNGEAFKPPYYRAPGNKRYAGALSYQGPWADAGWEKGKHPGHKRGLWDLGQIWLRYYATDRDKGKRGGVRIPRITYELADRRQFFIVMDLERDEREANTLNRIVETKPEEPRENLGKKFGWYKSWGIPRGGFVGAVTSFDPRGNFDFFTKGYVRDLDRGLFSRGEELPAPANYEPTATSAAGVSYLGRGMSIGRGKVFVLTGRLPTTPRTRDGTRRMEAAQARYWSITTYDLTWDFKNPGNNVRSAFGSHVTSLMDDEIVTDENGWYIIAYSRPENRPRNAIAANGVTWVDWGPVAYQGITIRWMSIAPEWVFPQSPDELHLQRETDWASKKYKHEILGKNNREGFLGDYQPIAHYMDKAEFERIGDRPIDPREVPVWR